MNLWDPEFKLGFVLQCVGTIGNDVEIQQRFEHHEIVRSCECLADFFELKYDYESWVAKTYAWTSDDAYEMQLAAANCADWELKTRTLNDQWEN